MRNVRMGMRLILVSYPVELAGGRLRKREHAHQGGKMCHLEKWHQLSTSKVLADFKREEPEISSIAMNARATALPKNIHKSNGWDNSLGKEYKRLGNDDSWLNITHEHRKLCYTSFRSFVEADGDCKMFLKSWQSLLAVPGFLLFSMDPSLIGGPLPPT